MHQLFRNRFLNTASFLLDPRDPTKDASQQQEQGNGDTNDEGGAGDDDASDGADDTGTAADAAAGDEDDGEGEDADDDGDDGSDDDEEDDDDPDLAGFTPEQRTVIKKRIAKETRWRDKQLERVHARRRSAEEDARAASAIAAGGAAVPENLTAAEIEKRARQLAGQMSTQEQYDKDCNETHAKGVKDFGKRWPKALATLPRLGGIAQDAMTEILATEEPHTVMMQLADPDIYERVMSLSPAKRRTEFVKLSMNQIPKRGKVVENKRPGDAPPPPRVIKGNRAVAAQSVDLHDDKVEDDKWYAERNRTRRKKFSEHV